MCVVQGYGLRKLTLLTLTRMHGYMQSITKHGTNHCLDDGEIHRLIEQQLWPLADMSILTTTPSLTAVGLVFKEHRLLRLLPDSHAKSLLKMF